MSELAIEREKCLSFSRKLKGRIELSKKGFRSIPPLTFIIFADSLRALYLLREIRLVFSQCDRDCLNPECLDSETAGRLRDTYMVLSERVSHVPFINFFVGRLVRRTLSGWDDLVEDMTTASDPEFRSLIMQIAEKVTCDAQDCPT